MASASNLSSVMEDYEMSALTLSLSELVISRDVSFIDLPPYATSKSYPDVTEVVRESLPTVAICGAMVCTEERISWFLSSGLLSLTPHIRF